MILYVLYIYIYIYIYIYLYWNTLIYKILYYIIPYFKDKSYLLTWFVYTNRILFNRNDIFTRIYLHGYIYTDNRNNENLNFINYKYWKSIYVNKNIL